MSRACMDRGPTEFRKTKRLTLITDINNVERIQHRSTKYILNNLQLTTKKDQHFTTHVSI